MIGYPNIKINNFNLALNTQLINKYIPTPEAAEIIISYFVFNNFQVNFFLSRISIHGNK
jgi:hypothetical protein